MVEILDIVQGFGKLKKIFEKKMKWNGLKDGKHGVNDEICQGHCSSFRYCNNIYYKMDSNYIK